MGERIMSWTYNVFTDELDYFRKLSDASSTNYTGSSCTDNDGRTSRTLSTSGVGMVVVDNQFLHPTVDYTISSNIITFINEIWNEQKITVWN